jgi:subtilisin-like proprotein convertase family protein
MAPQHDYAGDLRVTLLAPDGTSHLLFARIGTNPTDAVGDNANFDGTYVFNDVATGDLWTAAASSNGTGFDIPPGSYRTQAAGPFATDSPGPAFTNMNAVFVNVPAASVNGTWTLRFEDCAAADTGTVTAAALTLIPFGSAKASIIGRVLTSYGAGIRNVMVTATGPGLSQPKVTTTSTFGFYRFDGLPAGDSYVISVKAKRFLFAQPALLVNLDQSMNEVNFVSIQ